MKRRLRKLLLKIFVSSGGAALYRWLNRKRVLIVDMHGIGDEQDSDTWVPLRPQHSAATVRAYVESICRYYSPVSIDDAVEGLSGRCELPPNPVVFTFDDGYRSNLEPGAGILEDNDSAFVLYVSTGHVEDRSPFWFDRLDYAIQSLQEPIGNLQVFGEAASLRIERRDDMRSDFSRIRRLLKSRAPNDAAMMDEVERLLAEMKNHGASMLEDVFECDNWTVLATKAEVAEYSQKSNVIIGSHTRSHLRLGHADEESVLWELSKSAADIEEWTTQAPLHFAYPDGSFDDQVKSLVAEAGYVSAVTTMYGLNSIGDDLLMLKRIHLPYTFDRTELIAAISGLFESTARVRTALRGVRPVTYQR